jgi:hypothetical protein
MTVDWTHRRRTGASAATSWRIGDGDVLAHRRRLTRVAHRQPSLGGMAGRRRLYFSLSYFLLFGN